MTVTTLGEAADMIADYDEADESAKDPPYRGSASRISLSQRLRSPQHVLKGEDVTCKLFQLKFN
jgi:hypothetical protein